MPHNRSGSYEAVIIGSGPNGLAAGITLAQAGLSVLILEREKTWGGGARSAQLTLPGFIHDICSAVHPLAVASPFFKTLPLKEHGLEWLNPPIALAHPFEDGQCAALYQSLELTLETLGSDASGYRKLMSPWIRQWADLFDDILGPPHFPRHPLLLARFGRNAIYSAVGLANRIFKEDRARGLFGGLAAHSFLPLTEPPSAAIGLVLAIAAHGKNWPIPKGGAQSISNALVSYFKLLGGEIMTDSPIQSIEELPKFKVLFFDLTPKPLLELAGQYFPDSYRQSLKKFQYGPGVFKVDWALSEPVPWMAEECKKAGTVHLGGTIEDLILSEQAPWDQTIVENPFVLLSQPTLFDGSRAPAMQHTAWAYCHVPRGSSIDMTNRIEKQVERFAPGFQKRILGKKVMFPTDLENHNPNCVGGDISGGIANFKQLFFRPSVSLSPYATPVSGWYICSASTPPGAGVHGMCGYYAAKSALETHFTRLQR